MTPIKLMMVIIILMTSFTLYAQPQHKKNDPLKIGDYSLVSTTTIDGDIDERIYRASLVNNGSSTINSAIAHLDTKCKTHFKIIDGDLSFKKVAAGARIVSTDTFAIRVRKNQEKNLKRLMKDLQWTITEAVNAPPLANAGDNQTVELNSTVKLDGSSSTDADGQALTYVWRLTSQPTDSLASLSDSFTSTPTFIADKPGIYIAQLIVNDGSVDSEPSEVQITAQAANIQLNADQLVLYINQSTKIRLQAQIPPDPGLDQKSVQLYRLDDSLNSNGTALCNLQDNGLVNNGDDIANDNVFSCYVTLLESSPTRIGIRVHAKTNSHTIESAVLFLDVVNALTVSDSQLIDSVLDAAKTVWQEKKLLLGDTSQARQQTVEIIKNMPGVADSGFSGERGSIWIQYNSGVGAMILTNAPGTKGGSNEIIESRRSSLMSLSSTSPKTSKFASQLPVSFQSAQFNLAPNTQKKSLLTTQILAPTADTTIDNSKVLIWDPFNDQFPTEAAAYLGIYQSSSCPKFSMTYISGTRATVNSVKSFTAYGTIIISTHGTVNASDGKIIFVTNEKSDVLSNINHSAELVLGQLQIAVVDGIGKVFAIHPSFISALPGRFEKSVIYNSSCESAANNTMANAFLAKGSRTYFGYTDTVNGAYAEKAGTQLLTNLVSQLANTGSSFNSVTPKIDPQAPNAKFSVTGDLQAMYSIDLKNGGFETGDLTSWVKQGDARVLTGLGSIKPTEGLYTGLISTGLGLSLDLGSTEQNFCLPKTPTTLKFDWNFNSEEFVEWCDSDFDDKLEVLLKTSSGTHTLFKRGVNELCGMVSRSSLSFDQSGPDCYVGQDGYGTGGNDCAVWTTGWKSESIDLSSFASASSGKGVTLQFKADDIGDSAFDTAIAIDNIQVVQH
jgi:hypothetical protein